MGIYEGLNNRQARLYELATREAIRTALNDFTAATGLTIQSITITPVYAQQDGPATTYSVQLDKGRPA
jgi:hypothetical protein